MTDPSTVHIRFSAEFKSQLRSLAKRYRQIRSDLQPLIDQLQSGNLPGDQIPGTGYTTFKVRLSNTGLCHRFGHLRPPMHSSPELLSFKTLFHKGYGFLGTKLA